MAAKFLNSVDLNKTQLLNAAIQNLASAPSSPVAGQVYYNTTNNAAYVWNGTAWMVTDATQATSIPNTALATNPLARANHTGTQTSSTISDLSTVVHAYTLDTFAAPVASVSLNSQKITNLATPTLATDASTKGYVDTSVGSAAAGIVSKPAVAVVSVANVATLSGLPTTDGVTLVSGQRILLTAQTTTSQNGPYVVASGAWTRPPTSSDTNQELDLGATWFVEQGTTYGSSTWRLATPTSGTITPGTTSVTITQLTAATSYTAGTNGGLQLAGNAFSVLANTGITTGASGTGVDFTLVPKKFSASIGDGSTTAIVVTHNLGTLDVIMQCRDATSAPENVIYPDMQATTTNTATFTFATAPTTAQYRVTVIG